MHVFVQSNNRYLVSIICQHIICKEVRFKDNYYNNDKHFLAFLFVHNFVVILIVELHFLVEPIFNYVDFTFRINLQQVSQD